MMQECMIVFDTSAVSQINYSDLIILGFWLLQYKTRCMMTRSYLPSYRKNTTGLSNTLLPNEYT